MTLTEGQQKQIDLQIKEHQHSRYEVDITLLGKDLLKGFVVHPKVMRPEKMTSLFLAQWLYQHQELYKEKAVIDMGCGSGILGIVTSVYGAKEVTLSDISDEAVKNTQENIKKFNVESKTRAVLGNIFDNIQSKADLIVFNHPFFPGEPIEGEPVSRTMLNTGALLHTFLDQAKTYLIHGGVIIMPYFHFAGPTNNPYIQAPQHGYLVTEKIRKMVTHPLTLQKGLISIYELQKE